REVVPAVQRVGILENSANPYYRATRKEIELACASLGLQPVFIEVAPDGNIGNAVAGFARQGGQALLVPPDNFDRAELWRAVLKLGLPTTVSRVTCPTLAR